MSKLASASELHANHAEFCRKRGTPVQPTTAIGNHTDGVPFQKEPVLDLFGWDVLSLSWMKWLYFAPVKKGMFAIAGARGGPHYMLFVQYLQGA